MALGSKKDVLIAISTSGRSSNIIKVLKIAKKMKIFTISFLGNNGGLAKKYSALSLIVKSNVTARIQESHIFLGHYIFESIENKLIKNL
jgi:D-sedoheptulose 7-phosphate isomerase